MVEREELKVVRGVFLYNYAYICARMLHWKTYFVKLYNYVLYYHTYRQKASMVMTLKTTIIPWKNCMK